MHVTSVNFLLLTLLCNSITGITINEIWTDLLKELADSSFNKIAEFKKMPDNGYKVNDHVEEELRWTEYVSAIQNYTSLAKLNFSTQTSSNWAEYNFTSNWTEYNFSTYSSPNWTEYNFTTYPSYNWIESNHTTQTPFNWTEYNFSTYSTSSWTKSERKENENSAIVSNNNKNAVTGENGRLLIDEFSFNHFMKDSRNSNFYRNDELKPEQASSISSKIDNITEESYIDNTVSSLSVDYDAEYHNISEIDDSKNNSFNQMNDFTDNKIEDSETLWRRINRVNKKLWSSFSGMLVLIGTLATVLTISTFLLIEALFSSLTRRAISNRKKELRFKRLV